MINNLFPTYVAMILAVNLFINSGILNYILSFLNFIFSSFSIPREILPLAIMKPISGSASLAYLNDIFTRYGTDSFIGNLSSVIQGCTDTTLYVISLYFGSVGIKKIGYSLKVALLADIFGIMSSIILVKMFMS